MEGLFEFFICLMTALMLSLIPAWVGLYRLWNRELRGKSVLSSWLQIVRLLTWLVLVAIVSFASVTVLAFIFSLFWLAFYWVRSE